MRREFLNDFQKEKVQAVSMEELRISNIPKIGGGDFQNGIRHYDLLEKTAEIFDHAGFKPMFEPVYVASSREMTPGVETSEELELQYGKGHIKTFTFRKLLTKLSFGLFQDDEKIESLALSYHQSGIQVGYGPNVRVCSNMTILGSDYSFSMNSRDSKSDIERLFNIIRGWANVAHQRWDWENRFIGAMKNTEVSIEQMQQFVGMITLMRLAKTGEVVPLNQGQLNTVCEKYVERVEESKKAGIDERMSLWDVYNMGTSVHSPKDMPSVQDIIPANTAFGQVITDFFRVPVENFNPERKIYSVIEDVEILPEDILPDD